jgi:hypothetical protein
MIVLTGVTAIYLVGLKGNKQKWGYIFGLLSAPFWFYTLIYHSQWILVIINIAYSISWYLGFRNYWLRGIK